MFCLFGILPYWQITYDLKNFMVWLYRFGFFSIKKSEQQIYLKPYQH